MGERIIGIMGAMPEEVDGIIALLDNPHQANIGMRTYTSGMLNGNKAVVVFSRWGKVAASATVSTLIHVYHITELIFTGVAGGINPKLKIGDVVVAKRLVQHDMDARPLMPRFEIPLLGVTWFESDKYCIDNAGEAINKFLDEHARNSVLSKEILAEFGINQPVLHIGDVASGDRFFAAEHQRTALLESLPEILCVEMEGAAVAQVCFEHDIPFTIIRIISDTAGDDSHIDFVKFIENISAKYSAGIISLLT